MTQKDFSEFSIVLLGIASALDKTLTPEAVKIYFEVLKNKFSNLDDFKKAAYKLLESWEYSYMPKPAHFIKQTRMSDEELEIAAIQAWNYVLDAIRNGAGYIGIALFEDQLTEHTVNAIGGMHKLTNATVNELDWKKKEFMTIFKAGYKSGRVANVKSYYKPIDDEKTYRIPSSISETEKSNLKLISSDYEPKNNQVASMLERLTQNAKI